MNKNLSIYHVNRHTIVNWYLFIILINLFIGFFFWCLRMDNIGLKYHLISPLIGGCVQTTAVLSSLLFFNPKHPVARATIIFLSVIIGATIAALLSLPNRGMFLINTLFGILIGSTIFGFAFYWETMAMTTSNLKKEQINRIRMEKKITEAKLRILQAQIEPHFLFNTLSNILNLFDTDMESGKSMQKDLIHYLESSLDKFRKDVTTIEAEIELAKAYLNIFQVRMGKRLKYETQVPENLKKVPIPPLMIQPLVENAIKHGIEPKIEGGEIHVIVEQDKDILRIIVADTGTGMEGDSRTGIGLTNIRDRLDLLYGNAARLTFTENPPSGLNAIIEVPYGQTKSNHRR